MEAFKKSKRSELHGGDDFWGEGQLARPVFPTNFDGETLFMVENCPLEKEIPCWKPWICSFRETKTKAETMPSWEVSEMLESPPGFEWKCPSLFFCFGMDLYTSSVEIFTSCWMEII